MTAMPIEWHEECLSNQIESHKRLVADLERATAAEKRSREQLERYRKQLERARKLGKKKFDSGKFGIG